MINKEHAEEQLKSNYASTLFKKIKAKPKYREKYHCELILKTFLMNKTMADFLEEACISRQRLVAWQAKHPIFNECVMIAKEIGRARWIKKGIEGMEWQHFNSKVWEGIGKQNFGGLDKISLTVDCEATPYDQYQQVIKQASCGDFTSSEIKQLMESVNIGLRAFEVCELQKQIDSLNEGLEKMKERELEQHQAANQSFAEDNQVALESGLS